MAKMCAPLCVALALLLGSGSVHAAPGGKVTRYTLHGLLSAPHCGGGYQIVGASVVVRNQANVVIGAGTTSRNANPLPNEPAADCEVTFKVRVPRAKFYELRIGTHEAPVFSFHQLVKLHWRIELSLP